MTHILPFQNAVQAHNEKIFAETIEYKVTIVADDVLCGNPIEREKADQHAHYVAASRMSSLEGLQILNWAPHLISVNEEVEVHMEYMNTHKKLELCFVPLYSINSTYKCLYINARSLHNAYE